jgi:hypothetical protein
MVKQSLNTYNVTEIYRFNYWKFPKYKTFQNVITAGKAKAISGTKLGLAHWLYPNI